MCDTFINLNVFSSSHMKLMQFTAKEADGEIYVLHFEVNPLQSRSLLRKKSAVKYTVAKFFIPFLVSLKFT